MKVYAYARYPYSLLASTLVAQEAPTAMLEKPELPKDENSVLVTDDYQHYKRAVRSGVKSFYLGAIHVYQQYLELLRTLGIADDPDDLLASQAHKLLLPLASARSCKVVQMLEERKVSDLKREIIQLAPIIDVLHEQEDLSLIAKSYDFAYFVQATRRYSPDQSPIVQMAKKIEYIRADKIIGVPYPELLRVAGDSSSLLTLVLKELSAMHEKPVLSYFVLGRTVTLVLVTPWTDPSNKIYRDIHKQFAEAGIKSISDGCITLSAVFAVPAGGLDHRTISLLDRMLEDLLAKLNYSISVLEELRPITAVA